MSPFPWPDWVSLLMALGSTAAGFITLWYVTDISPMVLLGIGLVIAAFEIWRFISKDEYW